jgi:hypothetical protein
MGGVARKNASGGFCKKKHENTPCGSGNQANHRTALISRTNFITQGGLNVSFLFLLFLFFWGSSMHLYLLNAASQRAHVNRIPEIPKTVY